MGIVRRGGAIGILCFMQTNWTDDNLTFGYSTLEDLEPFSTMLAKERVCEHVFFGPNSHEETLGFFQPLLEPMCQAISAGRRPDVHVFTIRRVDDDRFLGQCALIPVMFARDHYQIGFQLEDHAWRQGIGTRACEFLLQFGFRILGADRLGAECLASNAGSRRILEKCGFQQEGHQRRQFHARGAYHDQLLFGLLREEVGLDLDALGERFQPGG